MSAGRGERAAAPILIVSTCRWPCAHHGRPLAAVCKEVLAPGEVAPRRTQEPS